MATEARRLIHIGPCVFSYPWLFSPKHYEAEGKRDAYDEYTVTFEFKPDLNHGQMVKDLYEIGIATFPDEKPLWVQSIKDMIAAKHLKIDKATGIWHCEKPWKWVIPGKNCVQSRRKNLFRDQGGEYKGDPKDYWMPGALFFTAKSRVMDSLPPPIILDRDGSICTDQSKIYGGVIGWAALVPYWTEYPPNSANPTKYVGLNIVSATTSGQGERRGKGSQKMTENERQAVIAAVSARQAGLSDYGVLDDADDVNGSVQTDDGLGDDELPY